MNVNQNVDCDKKNGKFYFLTGHELPLLIIPFGELLHFV